MDQETPDSTSEQAGTSETAHEHLHTIDRRAFMGGGLAVFSGAALFRHVRELGLLSGSPHPVPAEGGSAAQLNEASPVATPVATPVASPVAATPVATPVPRVDQIGSLQVIWDEQPIYDGASFKSDLLRIKLLGERNLDFTPAAFRQDFQVMCSYLDPLVMVDPLTLEPVPWLASGWEWSDDNKVITYQLRDDVFWHDGNPLQARDVVFSFYVYRDDVMSAVRNLFTNMDAIEAVDEHTVKVTLIRPDGNWLLNASTQMIFQRRQYTKHWSVRPEGQRSLTGYDWEDNPPIGTGPWRVTGVEDEMIGLERNNDYWGAIPNFARLEYTWTPDQATRIEAWRNGDTDIVYPLQPSDIAGASDKAGLLYAVAGASVMFGAFNFQNPARATPDLLADLRIRQALSLLVDRDRYARDQFLGFMRQNSPGTVAQPWAHDGGQVNPDRDVKAARKLLNEAGITGDETLLLPDGAPFALNCIVRNNDNPSLLALLESLTADFAEGGVGWTVTQLGAEQFTTTWTVDRNYDVIAYAYNLFPGFTDYDLYGSNWDIRLNPQGWNPGGYDNETVDDLLKEILVEPDLTVQRELLVQLQEAVTEDLFGLWFGFPYDLALAHEDIQGLLPNKLYATWNTSSMWRQPS